MNRGKKQWVLWNGKRYMLIVSVMRRHGPRTTGLSVKRLNSMMPSVSASTVVMISDVTKTTGSFSEKRVDTWALEF
jgi:hypothetical protein